MHVYTPAQIAATSDSGHACQQSMVVQPQCKLTTAAAVDAKAPCVYARTSSASAEEDVVCAKWAARLRGGQAFGGKGPGGRRRAAVCPALSASAAYCSTMGAPTEQQTLCTGAANVPMCGGGGRRRRCGHRLASRTTACNTNGRIPGRDDRKAGYLSRTNDPAGVKQAGTL
jgi:hypothetical protein